MFQNRSHWLLGDRCVSSSSDIATDSAEDAPAAVEPAPELLPPHQPVLLQEVLDFFTGMRVGIFIDGTLGAGGHAAATVAIHQVRDGETLHTPTYSRPMP